MASLLWDSSWWVFRGLWGESCGQGIPMGMRMKNVFIFHATSLPFLRMSLHMLIFNCSVCRSVWRWLGAYYDTQAGGFDPHSLQAAPRARRPARGHWRTAWWVWQPAERPRPAAAATGTAGSHSSRL